MATDAKKAAAAAAPAAAAATANTNQHQQQQQALFEAKHAELVSEARDVAREFGVDVHSIAFRPDGTAVRHDILGVGREARVKDSIMRAVARDVSAMGPEEVAAHEKQLQRLRALVAHELQGKAAKAKAAAGAERSPEQQEMDGAAAGSSNKIRRIE
ncbi:hypothetical protein BAE44_0025484 [Dichanthelium oligosanthes]|uniref:Uncharacterized protein n=1 Tax=Dichanthelium oligosanthes TaxID=888268 RepID=A0A1E5UL16_9POAL|nr:hypothetical protein BAE44_0025484 [Dichanthelium oligosanthes]